MRVVLKEFSWRVLRPVSSTSIKLWPESSVNLSKIYDKICTKFKKSLKISKKILNNKFFILSNFFYNFKKTLKFQLKNNIWRKMSIKIVTFIEIFLVWYLMSISVDKKLIFTIIHRNSSFFSTWKKRRMSQRKVRDKLNKSRNYATLMKHGLSKFSIQLHWTGDVHWCTKCLYFALLYSKLLFILLYVLSLTIFENSKEQEKCAYHIARNQHLETWFSRRKRNACWCIWDSNIGSYRLKKWLWNFLGAIAKSFGIQERDYEIIFNDLKDSSVLNISVMYLLCLCNVKRKSQKN